jgi:sugar lactone lactonase YvrE
MSEGEKARIRTGRIRLAVALTAATGGNIVFIPNMALRNEALAARPDGKFLYTLDLEGHEVTVVDVESAGFVKRIPVDHSAVKLLLSSDGKQILCMPAFAGKGKVIQRIDVTSNNLLN